MRVRFLVPVALLAAVAAAEETTSSWEKWSRERADALVRQGSFEEAIEELNAVARLRPSDVKPLSRAAVLAVEADQVRGKELATGSPLFSLADRMVQEAVPRWGQSDPGLAYAVGRLRYVQRDWGRSWRMLRQAKETGFDPLLSRFWYYRAVVNRSVMLIDQQRFIEAKDSLAEMAVAMPEHPQRNFLEINLAASHRGLDEPEEAMKLLRTVLERTPDIASAHYQWGLILARQGRLEEAVSRLREAMRYASASSDRGTFRNALLQLGDAELKMGKPDDADATAKQALAMDRDDPEALFLQGRVFQDKNDLDHALPLYRRVARLRPDALETLEKLAQVLYQLGLKDEADEVRHKIDDLRRKREANSNGDREK
jgi:tetratricopeptide (TPR) repeat protein